MSGFSDRALKWEHIPRWVKTIQHVAANRLWIALARDQTGNMRVVVTEGENPKDNQAKAYFRESRREISKKIAYRLANEGRRLSVAFHLLVVLWPVV